ncbi:MAG: exosortase/archaeosortase family protein [Desulfobacterales bacterium]
MAETNADSRKAHLVFFAGLAAGAALFHQPLGLLCVLTRQSELYSHIPLIPAVSLFLLWLKRSEVFSEISAAKRPGAALGFLSILVFVAAQSFRESLGTVSFRGGKLPNDFLSLAQAGFLCWVYGGFLFAYGRLAFRKALFPLGFLLFLIPLPVFAADFLIHLLQHASAELSNAIFSLLGTTYHRVGLNFEFANLTVYVAEECSGIRSSMALFILSVLAGNLFLSSTQGRVLLVAAVLPIATLKNAFRIVLISLLANYVDLRFVSNHWLHTMGGMPFFLFALLLFVPVAWVLRRRESRATVKIKPQPYDVKSRDKPCGV